MISPSEGMTSLASQTTRSPLERSAAGTSSSLPSGKSRRASVSERILRRVSACALPRPSAIASAKLAKSTVKNSHTVIDHVNVPGCANASNNVMIEPTNTTNMTGFFTWTRGSNLVKESFSAWRRIGPSNRPRAWATPWPDASGVVSLITVVIRRTSGDLVARQWGRGRLRGRTSVRR